MKELYEIGIVFRGFVLVSHVFKNIEKKDNLKNPNKDLRGAFISAINLFAKNAFNNLCLEYLESNNILFIFKAFDKFVCHRIRAISVKIRLNKNYTLCGLSGNF